MSIFHIAQPDTLWTGLIYTFSIQGFEGEIQVLQVIPQQLETLPLKVNPRAQKNKYSRALICF